MSALLLLALACSTPEPPKPPEAPKPPEKSVYDLHEKADQLDYIFISMDAMRFDRTGAGGAHLTPNLDAFAKDSVVFTHTTSAASWTVPSHMAMFTSRWPTRHGVVNKLKPSETGELVWQSLSPDIHTFPESLLAKGWTAVAFTGGAGVSAKFGLCRGCSPYLDDKPFAGMDYSGPAAEAWLKDHAKEHFFMFFHGYDVHGQHPLLSQDPRAAVPDYKGKLDGSIEEQAKLREEGLAEIKKPGDGPDLTKVLDAEDTRFLTAIYDAKVKDADERLGHFLQVLKDDGVLDHAVVTIVGDHGEEFMEHKYIDHGATLCEHQLHVPMMIHLPGGVGAKVVDTPVRTIDVFPTVFDMLGIQGPADVDGKSLRPLLEGQKMDDLPIFAETDYRLFVHLRATRVGDKKLILDLEDNQKSLFDIAADGNEQSDLSAGDARTTYELEQRVRGWMQTMKSDPNQYLGLEEEHIKLF